MKKLLDDLTHHTLHFLLLTIITFGGLSLLFASWGEKELQFLILLSLSFFYVGWGIIHHVLTHKLLHSKVVIEYVLIAALTIVILWGIIGI